MLLNGPLLWKYHTLMQNPVSNYRQKYIYALDLAISYFSLAWIVIWLGKILDIVLLYFIIYYISSLLIHGIKVILDQECSVISSFNFKWELVVPHFLLVEFSVWWSQKKILTFFLFLMYIIIKVKIKTN